MIALNLIPGQRRRCKRCGVSHPHSFYQKAAGCKDGIRPVCNNCMRADGRAQYRKNSVEIIEYQKAYYRKNRDKILARHKWRYYNDPTFNSLTPEERSERARKHHRRRRANPITAFADRMRVRLRTVLNSKGYSKKSVMFERLGYTQTDLHQHLREYLARPCELCGFMLTMGNTEIDHIVPLYTAVSEEDIWQLNALSNLRMICGDCNRRRPKPKG